MNRHRFHSICPYFAMFPEAFAERWIGELSLPGDVVIDPFAGRGTAPFQALLMGRHGVGMDINPVAACLNRAKLNAPTHGSVTRRLDGLRGEFVPEAFESAANRLSPFFHGAYHPDTLRQLLYLRASLKWRTRRVDNFISALVLGAMHGETTSTRYLSNQMPRTISTKPAYSLRYWSERSLTPPRRDVFDVLAQAAVYRFDTPPPGRRGTALHGDMRTLPQRWRGPEAKLIITSPPYFDLVSYEEDQWLRLWFLGGPEYPSKGRVTRDDQRASASRFWPLIDDLWTVATRVLADGGHIVVRLGAKGQLPEALLDDVKRSAARSPRRLTVKATFISEIARRQTDSFRPGSRGCRHEVDIVLSAG